MIPGERAAGSIYNFGAGAGAGRQDGGAQPRPHSSGFRTFLNWFKRAEVTRRAAAEPEDAPRSRTPDLDSDDDSTDSETSTATAASFAFLSPAGYRPYGDAIAPRVYVASGPYTDTYRRRVAERERRRRLDSGVTLRKKYNLHGADATLSPLREAIPPDAFDYDTFSLPAMSRRAAAPEHRRAASETKFERPVSYVHVKGKRRAPPPPVPAGAAPAEPLSATLTRRVKRLAPQPPAPAPDPDPPKQTSPPASPERFRASQLTSHPAEPPASPSAPRLWGPVPGVTQEPTLTSPEDQTSSVQPTAPPLTKMWLATSQAAREEPQLPSETSSPMPERVRDSKKPQLLHSMSEDSWKPPTLKENGELSPRPWYKRQFSEGKAKTKSHNEEQKTRSKPELPEIGFFRYSKIFESKKNATSPKNEDKRFSHALPNISELDREAGEILKMHKQSILEENNNIGNDVDSPSFSNPRSARLLISKFNDLNRSKNSENPVQNSPVLKLKMAHPTAPLEPTKQTDNMQTHAAQREVKLKSGDDTWVCMRCEKRNNCKKIICSSCFSRKPKEEDLFDKNIKQDLLKSFESEVLDALAHLGNMSKNDENKKNVSVANEVLVLKDPSKVAKNKIEEQQKLRQILKEMKNSLPKQPNPDVNNGKSVIGNSNDSAGPSSSKDASKLDKSNSSLNQKAVEVLTKPKNDIEPNSPSAKNILKVTKTSSSAQTQNDPVTSETTKTRLQPATIIENSLYANVQVPIPAPKIPPASPTPEVKNPKLLLKELEAAIAKGDDQSAAEIAKRLAQMKVNCTVMSSAATLAKPQNDEDVTVEVYIEDAESAAGPVRLRVRRSVTLPELRAAAQRQLDIPSRLQRWIVGKQLCVDDAPLARYNGGDFAQPLFLYLVSPAKAEGDTKAEEKASPAPENLQKAPATNVAAPGPSASEAISPAAAEPAPSADHYHQLVQLESQELIPNAEPFTCGVCLEPCSIGGGVLLRECLHTFCRDCLAATVRHCDTAQVLCPFRDAQYSCDCALQEREVRALVTAAEYERHLARSVQQAESNMRGTFHCKTADCGGWCVYENTVNVFRCPICRRSNCLTCQAIHEGEDCAQYQARVRREAEGGGEGAAEAERTRRMLEDMCARGDALVCPTCQVVLMKKWGCDWVRCSMCKTEICWVTRGARWGPAGRGDTSAGCRCGVNGVKCHPSCSYCH